MMIHFVIQGIIVVFDSFTHSSASLSWLVNIGSNLFLFAYSALECHLGNNITSRRNISCFTYRMFSSGKNGLGLQYNPFNRRQNDCTQL